MPAVVTRARRNLAGNARLHQEMYDPGSGDGVDRRWLEQHGIRCAGEASAVTEAEQKWAVAMLDAETLRGEGDANRVSMCGGATSSLHLRASDHVKAHM